MPNIALEKTRAVLPAFLVVVIAVLVFFPILKGSFVRDDYLLLYRGIHSPVSLQSVFSLYLDIPVPRFFRPLIFLAFALSVDVFGFNPFYYHLVNLAIHCCNSVLVFLLGGYFFRSLKLFSRAFWAGMIFAVHPRNIEAVAAINSFPDLLCTIFFLIAFLFFLHHQRTGSLSYFIFSLVFFIVSLFSKESALIFPLIAVATLVGLAICNAEIASTRAPVRYQIITLLILSLLYLFIRLSSIGTLGVGPTEYADYSPVHIGKFVLKGLLAPFLPGAILSLLPENLLKLSPAVKLITTSTMAFGLAITFYFGVRRRRCLFPLLFLLLTVISLLPVSPFSFSLTSSRENRFLYTAIVFSSLFIVGLLAEFVRSKRVLNFGMIVLSFLFSYLVKVELISWGEAYQISASLFSELVNLRTGPRNPEFIVVLDAPVRYEGAPVGMSTEEVLLALENGKGEGKTTQEEDQGRASVCPVEVLTLTDVRDGSALFPVRWISRESSLIGESTTGEKIFVGLGKKEGNAMILRRTGAFAAEAIDYDSVSFSCSRVRVTPISSFPDSSIFISCGLGKIQKISFPVEDRSKSWNR